MGAIPIRNVWCVNKNRKQGTLRYSKQVKGNRTAYTGAQKKEGGGRERNPICGHNSVTGFDL